MTKATVDHANGKVTLTLPIGNDGCAYTATMSPNEARDLASALVARTHTAEATQQPSDGHPSEPVAPWLAEQPTTYRDQWA